MMVRSLLGAFSTMAVLLTSVEGQVPSTTSFSQVCTPWAPVVEVPSDAPLYAVAYGAGRFVAVGERGTILSSPDGRLWTRTETVTTATLIEIIWTGSSFLAVGANGTVATSTNGFTWQASSVGTQDWLWGVASGGGLFVAVGYLGAYVSADGSSWVPTPIGQPLARVTWTGDRFVAVGGSQACEGVPIVVTSPDGIYWNVETLPPPGWFGGVVSDGARIIVVGNWPAPAPFSGCVFRGLIADRTGDTPWSIQYLNDGGLWSIKLIRGEFVAVGHPGFILRSADGRTWVNDPTSTLLTLFGIAASDTARVIVGDRGTILRSDCLQTPRPVRRKLSHSTP